MNTVIRVSLSNVQGEGAVQLVGSLLPALERQDIAPVGPIDLPDRGPMATYERQSPGPTPVVYRRLLPNALSRLAECLRMVPRDDPALSLLVLGDLPLRTRSRQTVFVHNTHVLAHQQGASRLQAVKFAVMRAVFKRNLRYVALAVVQTALMQRQLAQAYPELDGRIVVLRQPPPQWLLSQSPHRIPRGTATSLRLFYPAAGYPHKNHRLIRQLATLPEAGGVIDRVVLTLDQDTVPAQPLLALVGRLGPEAMRQQYAAADALFFPSLSESYGLPLVEAMWLGLPIVSADLPYARELCGETALYFDPHSPASAFAALSRLSDRLAAGWVPDWRRELGKLPRDWDEVARSLVLAASGAGTAWAARRSDA